MRSILLIINLLLLGLACIAQQTLPINNLLLGYQDFPTTITGHTSEGSGSQYYTGIFRGELKVNNQTLATGNGLEDIFWVKTDTNGQVKKFKTFGSANSENSYVNSMAMGSTNMLFGLSGLETFPLGDLAFVPYTYSTGSFGSALVCMDTAGSVRWVRRTTLQNFRIYFANNVYHIFGLLTATMPAIQYESKTVTDSVGRPGIVHLMVDENGNFLSAKTITARRAGQNISLVNAAFFTDKKLFLHLRADGDTSLYINNTLTTLPQTFSNYHLFVRIDTAYLSVKLKVLNPLRHNIAGVGNQSLASGVGPGDSIYTIYTHDPFNGIPYGIDGFAQPAQRNTLYVMDSLLTVRRAINLSNSFAGSYPLNIYKRRIYFRHLLFQNGQLYLNGVYTGINESPINAISIKDTTLTILPGVAATVDQNGPSRSFIANCDLNGLNGSFNWYGDHREYENLGITPAAFRSGGVNRLAFFQTNDNVWNPWLIDNNLNVVAGSMRKNADMPEIPQMTKFFSDGSRVVIGFARGKTALDTAATFTTNAGRRDVFIARIRANNQVVWYKRFHSTLVQPEIRGLDVRDGKAWFLANYVGTQNDSNFIRVDLSTYPVRVNASLMASIDTSGNVTVLNLTDPTLRLVYLRHFAFFNNGDLLLSTDGNYIAYKNFPLGGGSHLFRLNPTSGQILEGRKIYGGSAPTFSSLVVDKNDKIYGSSNGIVSVSSKFYLHNGTGVVDSLLVPSNGGPLQSVWKLGWNKLNWVKRFSNGGTIPAGKQSGDLLLVNDKPVVYINPFTTNTPLFWEGQLVHNGISTFGTTLVSLDTNGNMVRSKTLLNISSNFNRKGAGEQVYVSGSVRGSFQIDSIQIGSGGATDGIGLVLDSNLVAKRSFRVASPYYESMADMDIYRDSVVTLAYTSQSNPQLYLNRIAVQAGDYEEDAYIGSFVFKNNTVTSINTPLSPGTQVSIAPNPISNQQVDFSAKVTEPLRSLMSIYQVNGQLITSTSILLSPNTYRYSIQLPPSAGKGVYRLVITNKKWTTTQNFLVL